MNIRNTKLAALSPTFDSQSKKKNQNELKEKELNLIYRQSFSSQVKPSTSQQNYSTGQQQTQQQVQGLLTQSNQQKLLMQQPQSAQTIRNYSVKGNNSQIVTQSQVKQQGQENLIGVISVNNNVMTASQQIYNSQKNGKIHKSQSLQKGLRTNLQVGSFKNLKNLKFMGSSNYINGKINSDNNDNIENENISEKPIQLQMANSSTNILNIQFNPSPNFNRLSDVDIDMKKSLANIRLPKLPTGPLTEKAKEKNSKNQQKLNNFVDNRNVNIDNRNSEIFQDDEKEKQKKNDKDTELDRKKDNLKNQRNSKEITNVFDQKSGTPPHETLETNNVGLSATLGNQQIGNRVSDILKKDDESQKVQGGLNAKGLRSNTPKQNNGIVGLKQSYSTAQLQVTPSSVSSSTQQSFGMNVFSTKIVPKKNSIQSLQQKQLRLLDKQAQQNRENQNNSLNNSSVKEDNEDAQKQQNKKGPLYISHYAHRSKAGCNYQGPKKNQDNFIIHPNLNKMQNRYLFAVCDGHGVNGHDVSAFIRNQFPKILETLLAKDLMCLDEEYISSCLKLAFLQLSQKLLESRIDCTFSGSTFVAVLIIDDKIWCANTGDSRGILCKQTKALWNAEELSIDHKADDPEEKKRIEASGGRVDSYRDYNGDPVGPARVWMKYDDIPGLAMSRSFGDLIAAQCGVICEPDIRFFNIEDDDRFIVIASDGVWEFLNNRQVMVHVMPYYIRQQPDMACQKLVKEATNLWKQHDEVVDDITAVCVFLHKNKHKLTESKKEIELDQVENPFAPIQQEEIDEVQKVVQEKITQEREKTIENFEEDLIQGQEDKNTVIGFTKNINAHSQKESTTPKSNQISINMKLRKEQSLLNQQNADKNKITLKNPSQLMQKYEQDEKEIEEAIEKEFNKMNNQISHSTKLQKSTTPSSLTSIKYNVNKSKTRLPTNHNEHIKKTEESSKNLIPDIDDSDEDSEYSKDFELDRLRAEKNQKQTNNNKDKQKKQQKNTFKGSNIQKYNFEEDDEDDDAFFKNL